MNAISPSSSPSAPPSPVPAVMGHDAKFLQLSREIAMDLHTVEVILERMKIPIFEWELIRANPRFQQLLAGQVEAWGSATNTAERVRLKSLCFVEEALPEFFARAHDGKETLSSKVEILKTVSKFGGIGEREGSAQMGERFSVTINLGDQTMVINKQLPSQVTMIDNEPAFPSFGQTTISIPQINSELG